MSQSEFEIIRRYFEKTDLSFPKTGVELAIGDDAALLNIPRGRLLCISLDILVADIHFPFSADPEKIANRALAVNLSDLAAMGAEPLCFTLGLVTPENNPSWLERFSAGLVGLAQHFNCPLVGGDITRGPLSIAIQVHGLNEPGSVIRRGGAQPGDRIYVTGCLGDGSIALASIGVKSHLKEPLGLIEENLLETCKAYFDTAYYYPQPRVTLALRCCHLVSSGIDISDGLLGDLGHITEASKVGAELDTHLFPYSESAICCTTDDARLRAALFGGDDYELCLTVPDKHIGEFERLAVELDTRVTCIGKIVPGNTVECHDKKGELLKIEEHAYEHFL